MAPEFAEASVERISQLVELSDGAGLQTYLDTLSPGEVARAITRLDEEERASLIILLEPEDAADLLEEARAHRDEIRKYLEQVSPGEVRTVEPTTKRTCYFCGGTRFWISVYGMTICTRCHPPAAPHLVADWLGEDPEHADRPPEVVH